MHADACPVREDVLRVAGRRGFEVAFVANGFRPIRPPGMAWGRAVIVTEGADKADDWIAEAAIPTGVALINDIPLAARALARHASCLSFKGHPWTENVVGSGPGRAEGGAAPARIGPGGGRSPMSGADRARFLDVLTRWRLRWPAGRADTRQRSH